MRGVYPLVLAAITGIILLFSCRAIPRKAPVPVELPQPYTIEEAPYQIIEHMAGGSRETLPDWAALYIAGGNSSVESLPRYANRYVFVDTNSSDSFTALTQWAAGFMVDQDFPQLVSRRVLSRFIGDGQRSPDRDFGRYFESAVKAAADTRYSDARREADFWLLKRYETEDTEGGPREVYDFYILVSIAKDRLQSQLNQILITAEEGFSLTKSQISAVNRLRANFYEGF
ncbi:MAG: hypothetical protein LBH70_08285 [Spirochaetaceae bacterium]|nr:hypothetical protein [Spirochaetaceae bacterium]